MNRRRWIIASLELAIVVALTLGIGHELRDSSRFAWAYKQIWSLRWDVFENTSESRDNVFPFDDLPERERSYLKGVRFAPKGASFLVTTKPVPKSHHSDPANRGRELIVVCDTPYIEKWWTRILGGSAVHVAAYSNGSLGLISQAEYTALDQSSLRSLASLP